MILSWRSEPGRIVFNASEEPDETTNYYRQPDGTQRLRTFTGGEFSLGIGDLVDPDAIHPDLFGLAAILLLHEFAPRRIRVDRPVSRRLHDAYLAETGKEIGPVDDNLEPRQAPADGIPALCLSFGTDSVAALTLMPEETVSVYIERAHARDRGSQNLAAAHAGIEALRAEGRNVLNITTDAETILTPSGQTHGMGMAWPIALLADQLGIDGIGHGSILETHYRILDNHFDDTHGPGAVGIRDLDGTFEMMGLPFIHVMAGLSEVCSTKIVADGPHAAITQSCQHGPQLGEPCLACSKCLRKLPLDDVIAGREPDPAILETLLQRGTAAKTFAANPMYFQSIYMYVAARLETDDPTWSLLAGKTGATHDNTDWMARWYPPAAGLLPPRYRERIIIEIGRYVDTMDAGDIARVEGWNLAGTRIPWRQRVRHWRFWRSLHERFGHELVTVDTPRIRIVAGKRAKLSVRHQTSLFRRRDISKQIEWQVRRKRIAKAGSGRVFGRRPGVTRVVAKWGTMPLSAEIEVTPREGEGPVRETVSVKRPDQR